jgi:cobalamin synthase
LVAVCVTVLASAAFTLRRISGLTGDTYGALCELSEMVVLLALSGGAL